MFKPGALLLVPFPFTDLSSGKRRPVLALTAADIYGDFIALAVTSRTHHGLAIPLHIEDIDEGALPVASWIRIDRVVTLNVSLIIKSFATVNQDALCASQDALCQFIGHQPLK
jgi:mRNA interferase MazF